MTKHDVWACNFITTVMNFYYLFARVLMHTSLNTAEISCLTSCNLFNFLQQIPQRPNCKMPAIKYTAEPLLVTYFSKSSCVVSSVQHVIRRLMSLILPAARRWSLRHISICWPGWKNELKIDRFYNVNVTIFNLICFEILSSHNLPMIFYVSISMCFLSSDVNGRFIKVYMYCGFSLHAIIYFMLATCVCRTILHAFLVYRVQKNANKIP